MTNDDFVLIAETFRRMRKESAGNWQKICFVEEIAHEIGDVLAKRHPELNTAMYLNAILEPSESIFVEEIAQMKMEWDIEREAKVAARRWAEMLYAPDTPSRRDFIEGFLRGAVSHQHWNGVTPRLREDANSEDDSAKGCARGRLWKHVLRS